MDLQNPSIFFQLNLEQGPTLISSYRSKSLVKRPSLAQLNLVPVNSVCEFICGMWEWKGEMGSQDFLSAPRGYGSKDLRRDLLKREVKVS